MLKKILSSFDLLFHMTSSSHIEVLRFRRAGIHLRDAAYTYGTDDSGLAIFTQCIHTHISGTPREGVLGASKDLEGLLSIPLIHV